MITLILGLNTSLLTHMDRTNIILYYSTLFFRQTTAVIGKKEPENKNGFFQPWKLDQFLPFSQTWLRMHSIVQQWVKILSKGAFLGYDVHCSWQRHQPVITVAGKGKISEPSTAGTSQLDWRCFEYH